MIPLQLFMSEMALLSDRFNRPHSMAVLERYYAILKNELTEAQFLSAALQVFTEDDFFPTPKRLLELGKASQDVSKQLGSFLRQHKISAVLPQAWQEKTGALLAADLTDEQQKAYLEWLKSSALPLLGGAEDVD